MNMGFVRRAAGLALAVMLVCVCGARAAAPAGETSVLKWRDGKKAVFLLAFDDSCQTHVKNVVPELARRGMVGTFYINPGNGPFLSMQKVWESELPTNPAVVYGNHTFNLKRAVGSGRQNTSSSTLSPTLRRLHLVCLLNR